MENKHMTAAYYQDDKVNNQIICKLFDNKIMIYFNVEWNIDYTKKRGQPILNQQHELLFGRQYTYMYQRNAK